MQLDELIERISKAYDADNAILSYFKRGDAGKNDLGDGLAVFIVNEICDTYEEEASPDAKLAEARRVMCVARNQILDVIGAIEALEAIERKKVREIHIKAELPEDTELLRRQRETFGKIFEEATSEEISLRKEGEET